MGWHFEYPARVEKDEAGFLLVTFPDFPEAATDCRSREAVLVEAADCLEEAVAGRIKRGEDLPTPSDPEHGDGDGCPAHALRAEGRALPRR